MIRYRATKELCMASSCHSIFTATAWENCRLYAVSHFSFPDTTTPIPKKLGQCVKSDEIPDSQCCPFKSTTNIIISASNHPIYLYCGKNKPNNQNSQINVQYCPCNILPMPINWGGLLCQWTTFFFRKQCQCRAPLRCSHTHQCGLNAICQKKLGLQVFPGS